MERLGNFIIAYPKTVITGIVILALLAIYPASNIRTDFDLEGFYPQDDPVIEDYQLLEQEFGRDDNAMLVGFKTDSLFTSDVLADLQNITSRFEEIENIKNVLSLWDAQQVQSSGNSLEFSSYLEGKNLNDTDLNSLKEEMTEDPLLSGYLVNDSATASAIVLVIEESSNTYESKERIIGSVNEILEDYQQKYTFHVSGIPYFRNQYVNMLNDEIVVYIAISSILIMLLLWYMYRTKWGVIYPMVIVWTTLLLTVAIMQLTGGYLEVMSTTIAPILLCVGIADSVHMISKYDDSREAGLNKRKSIIEMLKTLGSATFLTSITTAIGFASLISSSVVPMKRFGIYTAVGVLIAYLVTITFLPAAIKLTRKKRIVDEKSSGFYPRVHSLLKKLAIYTRLSYGKILIAGIIVTVFFGIGLTNLDVNGRVFDDIGEDTQLMRDSRFFTENISPQFPLEFVIDTGSPDSAITAGIINKASRLDSVLREYPEIHRVAGLHTLIGQIHQEMNPDSTDRQNKRLPTSDSAVAQYVLLLEINGSEALSRYVDFDFSKLRITAFTEDAGSQRINQIRNEISSDINEIFPASNVIITGTTILNADLTDKIVYSLAWSIILALVVITAIMVFMFKNIRLIIIALVPNVIPLLIVGGLMGYLNFDIKPSTAVIFTIALGIAVDDSIHYLARFRVENMRSGAFLPSLATTTIRTGRAIIITSLILVAGFGTLITSAFTSTTLMGALVCMTILSALFADLFLLPALFYWLKPKINLKKSSQ
ncbi:MAG: MMPL family transporter [Balneolaceae bacterium]|nr:MMPL family transporter [Balneolaceae bacterium]MDR9408561.1 MMPL family transporter [Balneolaceae bacterium]